MRGDGACSFIYRYIPRKSCSQFDSLPPQILATDRVASSSGERRARGCSGERLLSSGASALEGQQKQQVASVCNCGGCSASGQYAVVQQGKKIEELRAHCFPQNVTCPPALVESFDTFGSWYVSFGIGALAVTLVLLAGLALTRGGKCPKFHWRVLRVAGVQAGGFWVVGNFFTTLAVVRGGNAVVLAQTLSTMIITSGLWGLVYYKEGDQSTLRKGVWFAAAAFTLASMILLGEEKVKVAA